MSTEDLTVQYGRRIAIQGVTIDIERGTITALMGPSGCGKSSFIRALNRIHDLTPSVRIAGKVYLDGDDIYSPETDPVRVRQRVGMVFQRATPFPMSIFDNVAYGLRIQGGLNRAEVRERVRQALQDADLWEEVENRLGQSALSLSGGQQQRLCIARALAINPEVLLMDELTSSLDPIATAKIEAVIDFLAHKKQPPITIVIVTHNKEQAGRVADRVGLFMNSSAEEGGGGELVEFGSAAQVFTQPRDPRTEAFLEGRVG